MIASDPPLREPRHVNEYQFEPSRCDWNITIAANTETGGVHVLFTGGTPSQLGHDHVTVVMNRLEFDRFRALLELAERDDMEINWPDAAGGRPGDQPSWLVAAPGLHNDDDLDIFSGPAL